MVIFKESQPTVYWATKIPEVEFVALLGDTVVAASVESIYLLDPESGMIKHKFDEESNGVYIFLEPPVSVAGVGDEIRIRSEWNSDVLVSIDGKSIRNVPVEFQSADSHAAKNWTYLTERAPCLTFRKDFTDLLTKDGGSISYLVALDVAGNEVWAIEERDYTSSGRPAVFACDYTPQDTGGRTILNVEGAIICFQCVCELSEGDRS
jgi:hypothetical protein